MVFYTKEQIVATCQLSMCCDSKIAQSDWQNHCAGLEIHKNTRERYS